MRGNLIFLASTAAIFVSCAATQPKQSVFSFYDTCAAQSDSFVIIAQCGKRNRNDYCTADNSCSAAGNAVVMYADSLAESV